jgi:hypothetical protein
MSIYGRRMQRGASGIISQIRPVIVGGVLQAGTTGKRLKMRGVAVWGIEDDVTTSFGTAQYTDRATVVNTIKSWGANEIRFRLLAYDYNNQTYMTKAQYVQEIVNWQTVAQAAGLYLSLAWWDSLDGGYSGSTWATEYSEAFPMMEAVVSALGPDNPWVFYEPFNEPNNISAAQWYTAMKATVGQFRSIGYMGILLIDTYVYSHAYDNTNMTNLENYDAGLAGMNGKNQLIFAKHDYANEYPNYSSGFTSSYWPQNNGGTANWNFSAHLAWETEFGNYNGSSSTVSYPWSLGASSWMASQLNNGTLAGATAFLFGPWFDANAMTASDNVTPTQWGGYVETDFLGAVT